MNLAKHCLTHSLAFSLLVLGNAWAGDRVSTGYISSFTLNALVFDGVRYRLSSAQEERSPVEVKCVVKGKQVDCEELTQINQRNRAEAEVSFDRAGSVTRVHVLDFGK